MSIYKSIKTKKIVIASDHAGFELKESIKSFLKKKRKKILDLGTQKRTSSNSLCQKNTRKNYHTQNFNR